MHSTQKYNHLLQEIVRFNRLNAKWWGRLYLRQQRKKLIKERLGNAYIN